MPISAVRRGAARSKVGFPNANDIRVSTSDELIYGTGTSGTTEKTVVDLALTQTLTNKTFTTPSIAASTQDLAAAGSAQSDGGLITVSGPGVVRVTAADGTKGVVLPTAAAGKIVCVKNGDAANAILKVYPATGGTINAIAANSAISMAAKTSAVFFAIDALTWFTIPLLPS